MSRFLFLLPLFVLFSLAAAAPSLDVGKPEDIPIDDIAKIQVHEGVRRLNNQQGKGFKVRKINSAQKQLVNAKNIIYNLYLCNTYAGCYLKNDIYEYEITRTQPFIHGPHTYTFKYIGHNPKVQLR